MELAGEDAMRNLALHYAPQMTPGMFAEWVRANGVVFFDVQAWQEHMLRFDAVVGPRFHGAMLAAQVGIPAAVIAHDSRTHELCETSGLPSVDTQALLSEGVGSLWRAIASFNGSAFDANRHKLALTYETTLQAFGIQLSPSLRALAEMP